MKIIEVQDLNKYYGDACALNEVSFSIEEGEIIGLLGRNGAGKSTLLKILACSILPSSGFAKIAGHDVEEDPDAVRKIIGFLPDRPPLYDEMTVEDYLSFVAKLKGVSNDKLKSSMDRAVEKTSLTSHLDYRLGELSHGFRQRVSIAAAIVHDPKLLILDEPINGLDPIQIVEMRDLIKQLGKEHTVVLSSHILSEITKTCDRIIIIEKGQIVNQGDQQELQASQSLAINCELQTINDQLRALLKGHEQVLSVKEQKSEYGNPLLTLDLKSDIRPEVAKMVHQADIGMLGMTREMSGLEKIFLDLARQ